MKKQNKGKSIVGLTAFFIGLNGIGYSPFAHAGGGDKIGGGGDIVTCLENGQKVSYVLDMYEAKKSGKTANLGDASLSISEKILIAKERYALIDPVRAERYSLEALKILQDVEALEKGEAAPNQFVMFDGPLKDIDDADEAVLFRSYDEEPTVEQCSKGQLVRQEVQLVPQDPFYTIDPSMWSKLTKDQKVATLFHEAIYKEFRSHDVYNSKPARKLNSLIISGEINNISSSEYYDFVYSQNGMNTFQLAGSFELTQKNGSQLKRDLDASGEIVKVYSKFNYQPGKISILIQDPEFKNRAEFNRAQHVGVLYMTPDRKTLLNKAGPETIELKSGVVEMLGAGRISLKGLIKSEVGDLSLVIDLDGNILEKQESGYYNETMSIRMSVALTSLVRCSIARLKNSTDNDFVGTLLGKAREYIPVKNETGMEAIAADCARGSTELEMQTSHSEHVNKWIETVRNPIAKECAGIAFTVQGAAAIGVKLGLASMKCTFSDGSRRFYMGPHLGFIAGGIGGGVMAGSFELEAKDQVIKKNGAMVVSARNMLGIPFVLIPESKGGQHQTAPGSWDTTQIDESRQVGLGFSIHASMFEAIPMVKIKKSKPDYTLLVHDLSKEILIKK